MTVKNKIVFNALSGSFDQTIDTDGLNSELALKAPLASPALTGNPTAPTQLTTDSSTKIATTAFVGNALIDAGLAPVQQISILDSQTNSLVTTLNTQKAYDISYSVNRSVNNQAAVNAFLQNASGTYEKGLVQGTIFKLMPDGSIICVGSSNLNMFGVLNANYIIKLNSDFSINTVFHNNTVGKFNSAINFVDVSPLGKIIVAGSFTNYGGATGKNYVVCLNSDGTEDTTFSANAVVNGTTARFNSTVTYCKFCSDEKVFISGNFTTWTGTAGKQSLMKFNSNGTEDTTFNANAIYSGVTAKFNGAATEIVEQADGKFIVGGVFNNYAGATGKSKLIRLNVNGTEDTTFSTNAIVTGTTANFNNNINSVKVINSGEIVIAGSFTNYKAQTGKSYLIKLNSDGTENTTFSTNAVVNGTTAKFNSSLSISLVTSDSKILIAGLFTSYNGDSSLNRYIALNFDGTLNTSFNANFNAGGYLTSSTFYQVTEITGNKLLHTISSGQGLIANTNYSYVMALNLDGTINNLISSSLNSGKFNTTLRAIVEQPDGKIIVGGNFTNYNSQIGKSFLIRLNSDGTEDTTFSNNAVVSGTTPRLNSGVTRIVLQSDNKIIITGNFTTYNGSSVKVVRLNSDGTEDTAFTANLLNKFSVNMQDLALDLTGKILIASSGSYSPPSTKNCLIRLNSDGTEDTAFTSAAVSTGLTAKFNADVVSIAVDNLNRIIVGGNFTNYFTQTGKSYLLRLNSDGTEDTTFSANAVVNGTTARLNGSVQCVKADDENRVLISGGFTSWTGATGKSRVMRFNANGTEDTVFTTNAVTANGTTAKWTGAPSNIVLHGKDIIFAGNFSAYNSLPKANFAARFSFDGQYDSLFNDNNTFFESPSFAYEYNNKIFFLTNSSYIKTSSYAFVNILDECIRYDKGSIQAVPSTSGMLYTTPVTTSSLVGYSTGVTISFNSDGTIKYTSQYMGNPSYATDYIKIKLEEM